MTRALCLIPILLLAHTAIAQPTFAPAESLVGLSDVYQPRYPQFVDLDADGDLDALMISLDRETGHAELVWYANDGSGEFGEIRQALEQPTVESWGVADVDMDGDPDVIVGTNGEGILWFENDGTGGLSESRAVGSTDGRRGTLISTGDLDGDGAPDLVSWDTDRKDLRWHKNDDAGGFADGSLAPIGEYLQAMTLDDLDSDGDVDLVILTESGVRFLENLGESSFASSFRLLAPLTSWPSDMQVGDLDEDGDLDIAISGNSVQWFLNDGAGDFVEGGSFDEWTARIDIADLDSDGHADLSVIAYDGFSPSSHGWMGGDGSGGFGEFELLFERASPGVSQIEDIDADGYPDMLAVVNTAVLLLTGKDGPAFDQRMITRSDVEYVSSFAVSDLDGDLDPDIAVAAHNQASWLEQVQSGFALRSLIGDASVTDIGDIDGDGRPDIVVGGRVGGWMRNLGGGTFAPADTVLYCEGWICYSWRTFELADLDGDSDLDVLFDDYRRRQWQANLGGGQFGEPVELSLSGLGLTQECPSQVFTGDLDSDGDLDIVSRVSKCSGVIHSWLIWQENDGTGGFGPPILVDQDLVESPIAIADIDSDGDLDIAAAPLEWQVWQWHPIWYENDGSGRFASAAPLSDEWISRAPFFFADVDQDGAMDLVSSQAVGVNSWDVGARTIGWLRNSGSGFLGEFQPITTVAARGFGDVEMHDLDGDGDLDLLWGAEDQLSWNENVSTTGTSVALGDLPREFGLLGNHPNPFHASTTIEFEVARSGAILLEIFDALGRHVETLLDRRLEPGRHKVTWQPNGRTAGVYFARLNGVAATAVTPLILMR